jgi:hypothetical protein
MTAACTIPEAIKNVLNSHSLGCSRQESTLQITNTRGLHKDFITLKSHFSGDTIRPKKRCSAWRCIDFARISYNITSLSLKECTDAISTNLSSISTTIGRAVHSYRRL